MKLDHRGDIGFMEAMAGAMTVCLALMSFTSYVAADALVSGGTSVEFDDTLLDYLVFADGDLVFSQHSAVTEYLESANLSGLRITASCPEPGRVCSFEGEWGTSSATSSSERHIFSVTDEEGITVPMVAEVVVYR